MRAIFGTQTRSDNHLAQCAEIRSKQGAQPRTLFHLARYLSTDEYQQSNSPNFPYFHSMPFKNLQLSEKDQLCIFGCADKIFSAACPVGVVRDADIISTTNCEYVPLFFTEGFFEKDDVSPFPAAKQFRYHRENMRGGYCKKSLSSAPKFLSFDTLADAAKARHCLQEVYA